VDYLHGHGTSKAGFLNGTACQRRRLRRIDGNGAYGLAAGCLESYSRAGAHDAPGCHLCIAVYGYFLAIVYAFLNEIFVFPALKLIELLEAVDFYYSF